MDWRFNLKAITTNYDAVIAQVPDGVSLVKTLILKGEKSNYITESDVTDFKTRFPNHTLVTILNAGHWVHAEQPKDFFEKVLAFITN
jgi:esterase